MNQAKRTNRMRLPMPLLLLSILCLSGCDAVYHYVVYPPPYVEYTLVPDIEMLKMTQDSCYKISRDSTTLIYDRKDWKMEVKYLTDFQLNAYDFPEHSTAKELSGNPYTYGNWVDPKLGYTPNRFTNFKVQMYNYSSSKINLDPEVSLVETDQGHVLLPYGKDRAKARYKSFEDYFGRLKGAGGSDDDLYDLRFGIIGRTLFQLSRPLFSGDSRDGIVTYDPVAPSVGRVKITYNNVILGYDENNAPARFTSVSFYFKRVPMTRPKTSSDLLAFQPVRAAKKDTMAVSVSVRDLARSGTSIKLLEYKFLESARIDPRETKYWDPLPMAIPGLIDDLQKEGNIKAAVVRCRPETATLADANVMMVIFGIEQPVFNDLMFDAIAQAIRNKAFLYLDDGYNRNDRAYPYENFMRELLAKVGKVLDPQARIEVVPQTNSLYGNLLTTTPGAPKKASVELLGLFVKGELVAVGARSSLYEQWDPGSNGAPELREEALRIGRNILIYGSSKKLSSQIGSGR